LAAAFLNQALNPNIAYDAEETRPFWKTRPLAMMLTLLIHWLISVGFTVLAVEALYFLAPNVKQRFRATCRAQFFQ
jgi:uncharacterized BrkB/YihY/UPF0761 family membrane protein